MSLLGIRRITSIFIGVELYYLFILDLKILSRSNEDLDLNWDLEEEVLFSILEL